MCIDVFYKGFAHCCSASFVLVISIRAINRTECCRARVYIRGPQVFDSLKIVNYLRPADG